MRSKSVMRLAVGVTALMILAGCAGRERPIPEVTIVPNWYTDPPSESGMVYITGTARSQQQNIAEDLATNNAILDMAKSLEAHASVLIPYQSSFTKAIDDSSREEQRYLENAIKNATKVVLADITIAERGLKPEGKEFQAYILVRVSLESFYQELMSELRRDENMYDRLQSNVFIERFIKKVE
ncbi:MAG: hypothetical protein JSU61_14035 [Fidelibacterota bacterium]|nr:MAG: hypothetical protein JSU61_14035 [Candidatus Neomarinimicrobiota bacterium]